MSTHDDVIVIGSGPGDEGTEEPVFAKGPVKREIRSVHPVTGAQLIRPAPWDFTDGASRRAKPSILPTPSSA